MTLSPLNKYNYVTMKDYQLILSLFLVEITYYWLDPNNF